MRYRLQLILLCVALGIITVLAMQGAAAPMGSTALLAAPGGLLPLLSPASQETNAVVLSTFSADIRGPSRALWAASICLLLIGMVIVRQLYTWSTE